jgi:hypothetical protein
MPMTNAMKPVQKLQVGVRALLLGLVLVTAYNLKAQSQTDPIVPTFGHTVQRPTDQASIRVKVKVVDAPVVVTDSQGELVLSLTKGNFRVYDDGVEQTIESIDIGNAPLSVVIVAETSSRVEALLPAVRRTGILFTQSVLGADGEAALIGYSDEVDRLLDFTSDDDAIEKAVGKIQLGSSGAHLYDALSRAMVLLGARSSSRRHVIVVLAEDLDTGSEEKLGQVISEAQFANITIYSVGLFHCGGGARSAGASGSSVRYAAWNLCLDAHGGHTADAHDRGSARREHEPCSAGRLGGEARERSAARPPDRNRRGGHRRAV